MPIEIMLLFFKKGKWKEKKKKNKNKKENKIKKKNKTNKQQENKQKQQLHVIAPVYITDEDAMKQLPWMINR